MGMQRLAEKDEAPWTRGGIEGSLVGAFRALPSAPVFSRAQLVAPLGAAGTGVAEILNWGRFLADRPQDRLFLWSWARCRAQGESFGALCRAKGWARATAEDGRRRRVVDPAAP